MFYSLLYELRQNRGYRQGGGNDEAIRHDSFVWSITLTDIYSGWTENAAVWNKGAHGVLTQLQLIEARLPFALLGFDSDNGSEFLNHHLLKHFQQREKPIHLPDPGLIIKVIMRM